jgi:ATP-dependent Clp protease ATP-binding subunit ClpC
MADGNVPQSLMGKAILGLDLPPLRVLEKEGSWHQKLDRALVAAAQDGTIFLLNRMHDRSGGISPVASFHVTEPLEWPIMAGKIQSIGTSTPTSFAKLQADRHWLAECFEAIEVAPANVEDAIKVLEGIKGAYETFHNVSYTGDAIAHAVLCANKHMKNGSLPGTAVDCIDAAGAAAQLRQGSLPKEVVEVQNRTRFIEKQIEDAIANHEFEKANFLSQERDNLKQLREKHKLDNSPAWTIGREEIEKAVSKLVGNSGDAGSKTN